MTAAEYVPTVADMVWWCVRMGSAFLVAGLAVAWVIGTIRVGRGDQ